MQKGTSLQEYPFKFIYTQAPATNPFPVQICIAVSKRKINKATRRNLIKRRIREAWRLNKSTIYQYLQAKGTQLALMVIYTGKAGMPSRDIHKAMEKAIQKLQRTHESHQPTA